MGVERTGEGWVVDGAATGAGGRGSRWVVEVVKAGRGGGTAGGETVARLVEATGAGEAEGDGAVTLCRSWRGGGGMTAAALPFERDGPRTGTGAGELVRLRVDLGGKAGAGDEVRLRLARVEVGAAALWTGSEGMLSLTLKGDDPEGVSSPAPGDWPSMTTALESLLK
jgi:hypothetical protein